jgi:hypothetical protein
MKKKQRLLTLEELWDIEAKHPFSAGNPKSLLAWVAVRNTPSRKKKPASAKAKVPA